MIITFRPLVLFETGKIMFHLSPLTCGAETSLHCWSWFCSEPSDCAVVHRRLQPAGLSAVRHWSPPLPPWTSLERRTTSFLEESLFFSRTPSNMTGFLKKHFIKVWFLYTLHGEPEMISFLWWLLIFATCVLITTNSQCSKRTGGTIISLVLLSEEKKPFVGSASSSALLYLCSQEDQHSLDKPSQLQARW